MDYKQLGYGLGWFSIGLGALELVGARQIARKLDSPRRKGLIRAFGAREMVAGLGLLAAPANSAGVWGRVAGDALDLVTLGAAAVKSPGNRWIGRALAFVAAATALDLLVANGLDRTTGKMWPTRASTAP